MNLRLDTPRLVLREPLDSDAAALVFDGWSPALQVDTAAFKFAELCDSTATGFKEFKLIVPSPGVKRKATDSAFLTAITNAGAILNGDGNSCGAGAVDPPAEVVAAEAHHRDGEP